MKPVSLSLSSVTGIPLTFFSDMSFRASIRLAFSFTVYTSFFIISSSGLCGFAGAFLSQSSEDTVLFILL